jgi:hypothetical protein
MRILFIIAFLTAFFSCITLQKPTDPPAHFNGYHKAKDVTFYTIYPYGSIMLPGEWIRSRYNEQTSQQFFWRLSDSTIIGLGKNPRYKLSCYKRGMSDYDVIVAFYKWDAEYVESKGASVDLLEKNEEKVYIVWQKKEKRKLSTFLYGAKDGLVYDMVIEGDSLSEHRDVTFLEKLYANN